MPPTPSVAAAPICMPGQPPGPMPCTAPDLAPPVPFLALTAADMARLDAVATLVRAMDPETGQEPGPRAVLGLALEMAAETAAAWLPRVQRLKEQGVAMS